METMKLKFTPIPAEPMYTILINGKKFIVPKEGVYEWPAEIGNILLKAAPHLFTVQGEEEKADAKEPDAETEQKTTPPAQEAPKARAPKVKRAYKKKGGK